MTQLQAMFWQTIFSLHSTDYTPKTKTQLELQDFFNKTFFFFGVFADFDGILLFIQFYFFFSSFARSSANISGAIELKLKVAHGRVGCRLCGEETDSSDRDTGGGKARTTMRDFCVNASFPKA